MLRGVTGSLPEWRCRDITIEELRVLCRQKDPFADSLLDLRHPVRVEIAEGAVSLIQPGQFRADPGRSRHQQRSLFEDLP